MLRRPSRVLSLLLLAACAGAPSEAPSATPALLAAHAHNDYRHARPLLDAIEHGFRSVEADVFAVEAALWVGHDPWDLRPERTLDALYLQPLLTRLEAHGSVLGTPLASDGGFILLVDFKRDGARCLELLQRELAPLHPHLTRRVGDTIVPGELTVVVSGDRPVAALTALDPAFVFLDGRPTTLDSADDANAHRAVAPLVSASWRERFQWRAGQELSELDVQQLREDARRCRERGQLLRYWALPHDEQLWSRLLEEGVTLLQADDLSRLAAFLTAR
jgi:hypothetical protein